MAPGGGSLVSLGLVPAGPVSFLDGVPLVDHHCHSVVADDLDRSGFESLLTEGSGPAPGTSAFDSRLGFSVRRWCSPVLGLPPHAPAQDYVDRRAELGAGSVSRAMLRAAGSGTLLVDHGFAAGGLLGLDDLAETAGIPVGEVVRLEAVAEEIADAGVDAAGFGEALRAEVVRRTAPGLRPLPVACKTVLAYRAGLDVDPHRPEAAEVATAADGWLTRRSREGEPLRDPVLLRHGVWAGLDTGLPLQLHTGFGDSDEDLHRSDPALLAGLARLVEPLGVPLMLLHTYPFHRQAAWMAQVFSCVYVDVSLAVPHVGSRAPDVIAEMLELAPFAKMLYASDAYGLPELHLLGALRFRAALGGLLEQACANDEISPADAERVAIMIARDNALRIYPRIPA
ncbi:amidohydrolase family protein [Actinomycetospora termitidis]|uniref:Amidohydrolase family protein n=1 Tax=Actinomycetospora termitidis TaxID=3053470 RepID=A0ABT7M7K3_9PSEU|nr:amidohydrolase family protein [Actinomycetospora sp. Odt1-22]MDL5156543.1 amidohydrolase family protein [Actinomycetospora sp. Odt1-22]